MSGYVRYGDEWEAEAMRVKKSTLVGMLRDIALERDALLAQLKAKDAAIAEARGLLRSTTLNWQEQCLFDCDEVLSKALKGGGHA